MNLKSFLKRFKWGALFPAVIAVAVGILLLAMPTTAARAICISVGVLSILAGALRVTAFMVNATNNPADLLSGVLEVAVAVWLFIASPVQLALLALALGIIMLMRAVAIALDVFLPRRKGAFLIVSCVVAAILVALAIVVMVDPFDSSRTLMIVTGVSFLFLGFAEFCFLLRGGFMRKLPSEYVRGMRELKDETEE